ncbi:hypothetical protein [Cytobacillus horneckiae]|uniref:hypothetical protein n=1 Tax=Cytobacillus horneckiae TaxID=549687 RepID=UPI003D20A6EE
MHLTEKQLKIITEVASQNAIKAYREDIVKRQQEKRNQRHQNTVLLLNNYRGFVAHCEQIKTELIEFESRSIQDLNLEEINLESIESIKRSRTKTLAMVMFIKSKVMAYKNSCSDDEIIKYRILEKKYIMPKKMTDKQIIESESIDRSTFYRHLNKATKEIGVLFFGVEILDLTKL